MRNPTLVTLVYCVHHQQVLMACRVNEPYVGYWLAPGGKIKPGESPRQAASRELSEETGIHTTDLTLRAMVRETSPRDDHQWLLFIYKTQCSSDHFDSDQREGKLVWQPIATLGQLAQPEPDKLFTPHVLGNQPGVLEAHYELDDQLKVICSVHHVHA